MAYPKITVNTGLALPITVLSDTIDIPFPGSQVTGTSTGVASGTADTNTTDHLINSTLAGDNQFTATVVPLPVVIGDRAIRTSGGGAPDSSLVTAVAATDLTLAADTFPDGNETYTISRPDHLVDTGATFITSGVKAGDIVWNTTASKAAYVLAVNNNTDLTLSVDIFSSQTEYNDSYIIYTGQVDGLTSSEGCLLYIGHNTLTANAPTYTDVKVRTVAGNDVTFANFPIGNYLPIQVTRVFTAGSGTEADAIIAIW